MAHSKVGRPRVILSQSGVFRADRLGSLDGEDEGDGLEFLAVAQDRTGWQ